jgi:hypothetical protein
VPASAEERHPSLASQCPAIQPQELLAALRSGAPATRLLPRPLQSGFRFSLTPVARLTGFTREAGKWGMGRGRVDWFLMSGMCSVGGPRNRSGKPSAKFVRPHLLPCPPSAFARPACRTLRLEPAVISRSVWTPSLGPFPTESSAWNLRTPCVRTLRVRAR